MVQIPDGQNVPSLDQRRLCTSSIKDTYKRGEPKAHRTFSGSAYSSYELRIKILN